MIDLKFRADIARVTEPVGRGLVRAGFTANRLTFLGVVVSAVASWQVALGHLIVAGLLGMVAGFFDLLDGPAAKAAGAASPRGAYFDSVADRVSESIMYFGLAYYTLHMRSTLLLYAMVVAYMAAQLTSYTRAKADAVGVDGKVGVMERAERQITLGLAALVPHAFAPLIFFLAAATSITAIQRMIVVWTRLSPARPPAGRLRRQAPASEPAPARARRLARH